MRLLQTASAINDHTLVTVARRKHVFAVQVLQDELEHGTMDYDTMINAGFGILLCEVLSAPTTPSTLMIRAFGLVERSADHMSRPPGLRRRLTGRRRLA